MKEGGEGRKEGREEEDQAADGVHDGQKDERAQPGEGAVRTLPLAERRAGKPLRKRKVMEYNGGNITEGI